MPPGEGTETELGAADDRAEAGCLMAILVDENTKLCVSGITGREGTFHAHEQPPLRHAGRRRA